MHHSAESNFYFFIKLYCSNTAMEFYLQVFLDINHVYC